MRGMKTWLREIDHATTEAELVAVTRDYVSLYSPPELAPLPVECRQIRIDSESDIPRWRERLAEGYARASHEGESEYLRNLVAYLEHASERLGHLRRGG